jgi:uncharacterized membrane protein
MNESTEHEPAKTQGSEPQQHHPDKKIGLALLSYIGPLIIVPFLVDKDDPFVKFHIKQGLLLVIGEVAAWMLAMMFWPLFPLAQIANIFFLVLAVVGIIRTTRGETKQLPLIGHWAKHFDF